ncbi:cyclin-dependent kinase 2-associated protein 1 isoform X1 [Peromyscus eremicus]|uniref:cyclin-dependent kinase 2-associated protein 1 isoform X1 n=1 Tax=Peromyscus eremicus TaxID=42410 RepID=UPI0027DC4532|nr:cyclin-dependent kinase 2-associated protein 1 isoform X1 [Peromyscus eremicus]
MPRQPILSQEEKEARARERDRLKKRRRREDGLRRSLERQRNALAMRRRRWQKREVRRRLCQEAELQGLACRPGGEAREWRRQRREEQAKALDRELATMVQLRQEEERPEPRPSLIWGTGNSQVPQSKYAELLAIIEELGKEIRPTYAGSKSAMERLKRGIIHARSLVRECLAETERNARS